MNRKVLGALVGAAVVAVVVWFAFIRGGGETKAATTKQARSGTLPGAPPPPESQTAAARAISPEWSLDVDPDGPLRLEGQVQGLNGEPIGGATVTLSSSPSRTTKSEDDGSFFFDKLVGRTYYLSATSGELVGGPITYKLGAKMEPVVIRLVEGSKLEVTVIDQDKQPIADAEVKSEHDVTEKTDAAGKALLKPVRSGWAGVQVTAKGFAPGSSFTTIGSAGSTGKVTVTLKKGIAISGRVIDEQKAPIAAAHLVAKADGSMFGGGGGDPIVTNERGEFSTILPAGSHRFKVSDGEHAPTTSSQITVKDSPISGIEIVMKGGAAIVGRVDDKDGKPVAYASVRIATVRANMWDRSSRSATTDKAGKFEIRGLTRGKHQARAESDASASKILDIDLTEDATKRDIVLVLDVSGTITGIVSDETGQPVAEVTVNAFPDILGGAKLDSIALAGLSSATTDGNGAFAIHGLPDGPYRLWASRTTGGFRGGFDEKGTSANTGDKGVKLTLAAPGIVIGKLALDGKPPTMATVQIGPQAVPTPVDNSGSFTIKDVSPGTLDAIVHGPEFAALIKHDVKIESGKSTDLGTIDVSRGRVVTGKVVDASGTPVPNSRVRVGQMLFSFAGDDSISDNVADQRGMRSASTDQDGNFSIGGVSKKAQYIAADQADKGQSIATQLPDGTDDPPALTLQLRGWGSITGSVTMKGVPQPGVNISESTQNGGAQMSMTVTDADGNFTMLKVAEGTHVLSAMQPKGMMMSLKSTSATVNVVAGQPAHVVIDIPVGNITLTIAIHPLPNNVVNMAQVFLLNGVTNVTLSKQLMDGAFGGALVGMKPWLGFGNAEFDELMPGDYTACTVPITGSMTDPQFQQRLQEHMQELHVYCKTLHLNASPLAQSLSQDIPAMTPLPQ